jgi:tetratricopeptide (TPR) repeat protein
MISLKPFERTLSQARKKEKDYEWVEAAASYSRVLDQLLKLEDVSTAGAVEERIGFCLLKAAMQKGTSDEFKSCMLLSADHYKRAEKLYTESKEDTAKPRVLRCGAMRDYIAHWLAKSVEEQKKPLSRCRGLLRQALEAFMQKGDVLEYCSTFHLFSSSTLFAFFLEWDFQLRKKMFQEAIAYGEQALKLLSTIAEPLELARTRVKVASFLQAYGFFFLDIDEREGHYSRAQDYWSKAMSFSEETAFVEFLDSFSFVALESEWGWGQKITLTNFQKGLEYGRKTKDSLLIGSALDWLSFHTFFMVDTCENFEETEALYETALKYAIEAKRQYSSILLKSPLWGALWAEKPRAEYYRMLAEAETDLRKKNWLLEKALEDSIEQLKLAESAQFPEVIMHAHYSLGAVLFSLSKIHVDREKKRNLLEKAFEHCKEATKLIERFIPYYYWKRGRMQSLMIDVQLVLACLTEDPAKRIRILEEATRDKENLLKLGIKYAEFAEKAGSIPALVSDIGIWQYGYGDLLAQMYESSKNKDCLREAVRAYDEAAEWFEKLDMTSRKAEACWKAAQTLDTLEDHLGAANKFSLASNNYRRTGRKIPQLERFYLDQALYMRAWTEIEKAKKHHTEKKYFQAKKCYEKAAELHKSTAQWSYLASNYMAWAGLEEAEDMSLREKSKDACNVFKMAEKLFRETRKSMKVRFEETENPREKEMLEGLINASGTRREYCIGRIALEEARMLDSEGRHLSSSRKYGSAAEIFRNITTSEHAPKDVQTLVYLSKAWEKMLLAEAKASPTSYADAARLFQKAKEQTMDESTSLLALANSSLCKALEAGARFEDTRNSNLHPAVKKHLEAARDYYLKAGFGKASENVKGTQHLFDAYMYLSKAELETDPSRKMRLYQAASRLLQTSVRSYTKAKNHKKSKEVQRLIEDLEERQKIARSLTELLEPPSVASMTMHSYMGNPYVEQPVGLESFEHANIQAHLTSQDQIGVGDELEVRLDLVNVGRTTGLLVRVDELVPEGLQVLEMAPQYSLENGTLGLKGKKLEPSKVESIKIRLEANDAGVVGFHPRIVYTDQSGQFWVCRPEAVKVFVQASMAFRFKTASAEKAFNFLVQAFIDDYMRRRLIIQEAGWRSLVQISKSARISLRSVYGGSGHHGVTISELQRRGLIETRIFPKERGRGGNIVKARICYDKETIKRYIDHKVTRN